ncbi:CoA-disulfide reductase [Priestia taiwanensis]|uniref:CoA-disulfide reductase n=1 Tax=Priestia taiwanensis TaxID=1347902 RepID=A0A917EL64_9BACI|nr:CoA-disulfide reductase [Priestia taiwanensis]MBM7361876.1 CoA-disulfide reductase [Priestia taiwanensis]GGE57625.1 CoA-disulfide reductase [Priestia taiwanensis]
MNQKIVIVGGVAGGATAAARLRRLNEQAEIVLFEKGEYISFANCGLPYYIGGTIPQRDKLLLQSVEGMSKKFNMDIRNLSEVIRIDRANKKVVIKDLRTNNEYEESYDKLILSPGAKPIKPAIPGIEDANNLFTLRNIPDTDKIKSHVDTNNIKKAVVIGGGFIGLEMAENLVDLGIDVSLIEASNQVMAPLDSEMAAMVHEHLVQKGVTLHLGDGVQSFEANGTKVNVTSGAHVDTDMIILSIGVTPENTLAKDADLALGVRGTIVVNEHLQTEDEDIYAIGDAIQVTDYVNGTPTMIPLAWPANRQGRLVADHINGLQATYNGTMGTAIAKVFDLTVASTGNNEKTLQRLNIPYRAIHIHPVSHAGYYPGGAPIALKLLFDEQTGRILGAQAVGKTGVDKRIDVIATAMKGNLTVHDLQDLELAYAPPYSSAKDPVNMAGYVAGNIMDEMVETVQWHEIDEIIANGGIVVDVREPIEREAGYISGTLNIPLGAIRERLTELPKDKAIYVSCQVGLRGYLASRILTQHGYKAINVDGGYKTYKYGHYTVGTPTPPTTTTKEETKMTKEANITLDTCGLQCPGPILQVSQTMAKLTDGETLHVKASDVGFTSDIAAWCNKTGNTLLSSTTDGNAISVTLQKGAETPVVPMTTDKDGATLVVFSGELDKAIASFIIATGAAAMGKKVTMFFTFWGLNILKKQGAPKVEKAPLEKMMSMMMPSGPTSLPLSKMNMGGLGSKMIQHVMKEKNVDDIQTLIQNALDSGVTLMACTMSMDVMGIKQEELIDGVGLGGVATYLGDAEHAGVNLFV